MAAALPPFPTARHRLSETLDGHPPPAELEPLKLSWSQLRRAQDMWRLGGTELPRPTLQDGGSIKPDTNVTGRECGHAEGSEPPRRERVTEPGDQEGLTGEQDTDRLGDLPFTQSASQVLPDDRADIFICAKSC
ncbi:Hypothetical predicted protein [Pelobates cultripes]|uniref:Uncharacterized protein n=1 Tax=Pelobates cultripes TaxID=61616 RepID=A0AAD1SPZ4_PELCU|nr:Hypothetical predicted protein [Pelobates cultripes]